VLYINNGIIFLIFVRNHKIPEKMKTGGRVKAGYRIYREYPELFRNGTETTVLTNDGISDMFLFGNPW
jgi:hypothetical protein